MLRRHATIAGCSRWLVSITKGRSDQGGCLSIHCAKPVVFLPNKPSSATRTAPTPADISLTNSGRLRQLIASRFDLRKSSVDAGPSRPMGAKTRT